jgi:hypothetical protein
MTEDRNKRFVGPAAPAFSIVRRQPAERVIVFVQEVKCVTCKRACPVADDGWARCKACGAEWKA